MKETSSDPPDIQSSRTGRKVKGHGLFGRSKHSDDPILPLSEPRTSTNTKTRTEYNNDSNGSGSNHGGPSGVSPISSNSNDVVDEKKAATAPRRAHNTSARTPAAALAQDERQGSLIETTDGQESNNTNPKPKRTLYERFKRNCWMIITHSWINLLLIFVPAGIIVSQIKGLHGGVVFAVNAIAIIPLAGLLSHATESVASEMGDALGALLNVTFGNAVELIIFIIALVKNQIRIVQASLLGSILANLLLILGMGFFLGGMRYQEQLYNSTVTQMSACLLSLSVISLVLPTAFHASFSDPHKADAESLKISRGTSVILLLVYALYLVFQLKSHAYLYESTPQHIVDAESTPGPAAAWLDTSSSDDSSSSSSDSDSSGRSQGTMRRKMKQVLRGGRRRKSSLASVERGDVNFLRAASFATNDASHEAVSESSSAHNVPGFPRNGSFENAEDAVEDEKAAKYSRKQRIKRRKQQMKDRKRKKNAGSDGGDAEPTISERPENVAETGGEGETRRVDFAIQDTTTELTTSESHPGHSSRRPFPALRGMSVKNVKHLAPSVFVHKPVEKTAGAALPAGPVPRVRYGIRRTNSLPDRLNNQNQALYRPPGAMMPSHIPARALSGNSGGAAGGLADDENDQHLSQVASIMLLLVSTALVAVCAEFLVGSIEEVTHSGTVGEIFIGLIILPIVGNAAEHVTALTVAMKNKMDLAIGVAVGSSIQIAIFITPLIVIIGWILDKEMTLYFTLFETVCLFVSAFMVNFLVLDGRSNYLEGALLCAVYVIISIVAFYYPDGDDASAWGE